MEMRTLLLADRSFIMRERLLIDRLEIGLADEGVRVARASPDLGAPIKPVGFSQMLLYEPVATFPASEALANLASMTGLFGPARPARDLYRQLEQLSLPGGDTPIDIIHAYGEDCWSIAIELASMCDAWLVMEVWSLALADRVRRIERELDRRGDVEDMIWLAPNEPLRTAVESAGAERAVRLAPWGVHALTDPTAWSNDNSPASILVVCSGHESSSLVPALEGIAEAVQDHPDTLVFLDAVAMRDHRKVWGAVESLNLAGNLSIIPDVESRRELALRADVLVYPEAEGELRTIILDAMAAGMTVAALSDPCADELIDAETAVIVPQPATSAWGDALRRILSDRERSRALGLRGRDFVREHRRASAHIRAVLDAYASTAEPEETSSTEESAPER